jgi:hypothetical protein
MWGELARPAGLTQRAVTGRVGVELRHDRVDPTGPTNYAGYSAGRSDRTKPPPMCPSNGWRRVDRKMGHNS